MFFAPSRLLESESFRYAAVYAGLFAGSMAVLVILVFLTVDQGFKDNLLRAAGDDLTAIRKAYVTASPGRGVHEAEEMIEDRMLAADGGDGFLLQRGMVRLYGNLAAMPPRIGTFYLNADASGAKPGAGITLLGQGKMIAPGIYAYVGRDLADSRESEERMIGIFAGVLLGSGLLAGLSGLWLSRRFLKRVDAISRTCHEIMEGNLGNRIPTQNERGELERLAVTVNGMLDRIQRLMESLRQAGNDIAHDLRTPLAHIRLTLEKAHRADATLENYRGAVGLALDDCDRLQEMFSALLRISRIEAGGRREAFREIDLGRVVQRAFALYKPVMDDTGHPFTICAAPGVTVRGDAHMLLQLAANLLDNAIYHTAKGTPVACRVARGGGEAILEIADGGPGIPAAERDLVMHRFFRLDRSRNSPGSGLGLALVSAIAELHGARIELSDNAPGLCARLRFKALN